MKNRIIFHIDCNSFYASVEETLHPELKKVPMAICGDPESRHGIILAKNQLAKKYEVKTAETIWQAKKKCPGLVLAPARHGLYRAYYKKLNTLYEEYTAFVEPASIDESYLDVTGSLHLFGGDPEALAETIRQRVESELKITVSIGISFNKFFAKMGSELKKPNAVTMITRRNFKEKLWPLPISSMFMVGSATAGKLQSMHIQTIGDLAAKDPVYLEKHLGKMGTMLYRYANGVDDRPVVRADEMPPPKSIGNDVTFKRSLVTESDIRTAATAISDKVAARLRRAGMKCMCVHVRIKDENLKVITRQRALSAPTWLSSDIADMAMQVIAANWKEGRPIRMLAIAGQKLIPEREAAEQLSLFESVEDKGRRERLERAVDGIRERFGKRSITPLSVAKNDLGLDRIDKEDNSLEEEK